MSINQYDRILKENIEPVLLPFTQKLLGLENASFSTIREDLHVTIERKPDFLKRVKLTDEKSSYILQIEFQSVDDAEMVYRMLEYRSILLRKYRTEIRQVVLYIGQSPLRKMTHKLSMDRLSFEYELIDIRSFDYELFLDSTVPEEVLLAILANFKHTAPDKVIIRILDKLQELLKGEHRFNKYLKQLEVLSKLRNLQEETVKLSSVMPIIYDLETDIRYIQGMTMGEMKAEKKAEKAKKKMLALGLEQGKEIGKEIGIEEGIDKGIDRGIAKLLLSNLLSIEQIASVFGVPTERVEKIKQTISSVE